MTKATVTNAKAQLHIDRETRAKAICEQFDCTEGDTSGVFNQQMAPRYLLLSRSERSGTFIDGAHTIEEAASAAGDGLHEGWYPECVFDLDDLAGNDPIMLEANYQGETWMVHADHKNDEITLKKDGRHSTYNFKIAKRDELSNVQYAEDERTPKRYAVADVKVIVVFNTNPEA